MRENKTRKRGNKTMSMMIFPCVLIALDWRGYCLSNQPRLQKGGILARGGGAQYLRDFLGGGTV